MRPQTLEEAWELNQKRRNCIVAGMMWLKMSRRSLSTAIDLCDLGLDSIEETEDEFRIGAMVTLRQMETHTGLNAYSRGAIKADAEEIANNPRSASVRLRAVELTRPIPARWRKRFDQGADYASMTRQGRRD